MLSRVVLPLLLAASGFSAASEPATKHDTLTQVARLLSAQNDTSKSCTDLFPDAEDAVSVCQTVRPCYGNQPEEKSGLCELIVEEFRGQIEVAEKPPKPKPSSASVWGYGILCVTLISMMSVLGVAVMPFMSKKFYTSMLTCLIGLAVGSLSGEKNARLKVKTQKRSIMWKFLSRMGVRLRRLPFDPLRLQTRRLGCPPRVFRDLPRHLRRDLHVLHYRETPEDDHGHQEQEARSRKI